MINNLTEAREKKAPVFVRGFKQTASLFFRKEWFAKVCFNFFVNIVAVIEYFD